MCTNFGRLNKRQVEGNNNDWWVDKCFIFKQVHVFYSYGVDQVLRKYSRGKVSVLLIFTDSARRSSG